MQLTATLEDESDDKTEGMTVTYNYTAHIMKCRKIPHRPDTNNIISLGINMFKNTIDKYLVKSGYT